MRQRERDGGDRQQKFSVNVISHKRSQEGQEGALTAAPQPHAINVTKSVPTKILQ